MFGINVPSSPDFGTLAPESDSLPAIPGPVGGFVIVKIGREVEPFITAAAVGILGNEDFDILLAGEIADPEAGHFRMSKDAIASVSGYAMDES